MCAYDEFRRDREFPEPLRQSCSRCGKNFKFPEMCAVTSCPHCGELQTPN